MACGFRRIAACATRLNRDTRAAYITSELFYGLRELVWGTPDGPANLAPERIDEIVDGLTDADLVGFSSMTGYADLTKAIIARLRERSPSTYILWGGIHPIIHPEDAIAADVDAICTGEGEFVFEEFFDGFAAGRDFTEVKNFWFKHGGTITRNGFRPLMTPAEMDALPFPQFGDAAVECVYKAGQGFVPMGWREYVTCSGLGYNTVWAIGCPFRCTYCGNTKFIDNDPAYRKIRYSSPRHIVDEVVQATRTFPWISTVIFHDDSFMAIPYRDLEEFAELWQEHVQLPFVVQGVIANYVRRDKFELLTWAGLNRIRMGIESGSQRMLDFYERHTPPEKIEAAAAVAASFAPRYHIPPAYDILMDNPVETRADVLDTLELIYRLPRPFTLLTYSLKVIPNTTLEQQMKERGVDLEAISASYWVLPPRWGNLMLYLLVLWRPPRWVFDRLLTRVEASSTPQKLYPVTARILRILYLAKRAWSHVSFMDFSIIPGRTGYILWRLGITSFWKKYVLRRPPRPSAASGPVRTRDARRVPQPADDPSGVA